MVSSLLQFTKPYHSGKYCIIVGHLHFCDCFRKATESHKWPTTRRGGVDTGGTEPAV